MFNDEVKGQLIPYLSLGSLVIIQIVQRHSQSVIYEALLSPFGLMKSSRLYSKMSLRHCARDSVWSFGSSWWGRNPKGVLIIYETSIRPGVDHKGHTFSREQLTSPESKCRREGLPLSYYSVITFLLLSVFLAQFP